MKRSNFILSALLVPALVLQGGTCTSGGSAPALNSSVTGIQTFNYSTATLYNFAVSSVGSTGYFTANTTYGAWCTNPAGVVPGGGTGATGIVTPPEDSNNPSGSATYTPILSSTITNATGGVLAGPNTGYPGYIWDTVANAQSTTTQLTLVQEWNAVNWVLNFPSGSTGQLTPTTSDTQAVIWQLLHPEAGIGFINVSATNPTTAAALYNDALANGTAFIPTSGQVIAVEMAPSATAPNGADQTTYQGFLVAVPLSCTGAAGGAISITKSANVTSANAFQLVTFTYTITNTGTQPLTNIVVSDDNGTPSYTGDDVVINVSGTLAVGASTKVTSTAYLPISLFYQSGTESAFDTLVVHVPSSAPTQLLMTYLIDSDVSDNTYGTGASSGWAGNGGHTFSELMAGYAEFAFVDSNGHAVIDFDVNYLKSAATASTYGATLGSVNVGGSLKGDILAVDSTLADDLNNPSILGKYPNDTINSPSSDGNWQHISGYEVLVDSSKLFGTSHFGSVAVKKNYLAATETGYSGKCGSVRSATYTPSIVCSTVKSTVTVMANVCGCSAVVHGSYCFSIKLNGCNQPTCNSISSHQCQKPVTCPCSCPQCKAGCHHDCTAKVKCSAPPVCKCQCHECQTGNHGKCTQKGCNDPICHANNCNHATVYCASLHKSFCW